MLSAQTWKKDSNGTWNSSSNWTPNSSPNSIGATATLGGVISTQRTITLTSPRTIGNLNINSGNTYWVQGSTINWNNTGSSNANLNVASNQEHWVDPTSNLQDNLNVNVGANSVLRMGGGTTGSKDIIKTGLGTLALDLGGTWASSGSLIVNGGKVIMERTSTNGAFAGNSLVVNSGGTVLMNQSNQLGNLSKIVLGGGTLSTGMVGSDVVGSLTLTSSSKIDLVSTLSSFDLYFASSTLNIWSGLLTIDHWAGDMAGGTGSRLFFGVNSLGLTQTQLSQINFTGFGSGAILLSNGELVPYIIPEIKSMVAAALVFLLVMWTEIRKFCL